MLGFLGPRGTFSYEAAKNYANDSELKEYRTITEIIIGLKDGEVDEAIVPIENSIQGGVTETIDALIENDKIFVNKEIILKISKKDFCACIANASCIEEYNLTSLDNNIQGTELNQTKFWIISRKQNKEGKKMSLLFSTKHKPGALYQVLGIFNKNQVNLTKIESRPAKTKFGDYIFLVDLEINNAIDSTVELLKKECKYLKILGKY